MDATKLYEMQEKVASLQAALLGAHPQIPTLLRTTHTQLRADPELVTTLSDEDVGILVNGLKFQTRTEIAAGPLKKETAAQTIKKALASAGKGASIADLF
jgi:hypothetical protein